MTDENDVPVTQAEASHPVPTDGTETKSLGPKDRVLLGDLSAGPGDQVPERDQIEPYLAALLQAEHLNLLIGSGLTTGLSRLAAHDSGVDMSAALPIEDAELNATIERSAELSAEASGRGEPNLEDRLRVAIAIALGLLLGEQPQAQSMQSAVDAAIGSLRDEISETEKALLQSVEKSVAGEMTLRGVLMTFLGSFAGRTPTRDRLHVFTTNYDRVLEWGAELAGLRIVDRFVGSLQPVFRSSRLEVDYHYSPPGVVRDPRHLDGVIRLTKLHGSLDWQWDGSRRRVIRQPMPFGDSSKPDASGLLIYPNAAKDLETAFYPYADLFRDLSAAVCRPHTALISYGYGFGDDHINRVIKDMLTIPSTHLLIISFDDPGGRIARFATDHQRLGQISLMIGPQFGSLPELVGDWLPRPSAEFLLQRRAQIYRDRNQGPPPPQSSSSAREPDA